MTKSEINPMPQFFDRYINQVEEESLMEGLENSLQILKQVDIEKLKSIGNKVYAEGKWTVKDIIQHIIDNERIMAYRALRISRNDKTELPGYDEELFGKNTNANSRTLENLIEELIKVRVSTLFLFKSFDSKMILNQSICYGQTISALALGFVIVGHQKHHLKVIKEKYESLI